MNRPDFRGASGDAAIFGPSFIRTRLAGFNKDMKICLTPVESTNRDGLTHAYFPALAACCGTLEYLTALYHGNVQGIGWQQVSRFAHRYLRQPDFDSDSVRVLFEALRHPIAHRGIATGVWIDRNRGPGYGRRLVWKLLANARRPSCRVVQDAGELTKDSPWRCHYTHRVHIHLRTLWVDVRNAALAYADDLANDNQLQVKFESCMRQLYPAG